MDLIFTHLKPDVWQYKVASTLRKKGIKTISISLFSFDKKLFGKAFDEIICLDLPNLKPNSIIRTIIKNPGNLARFFNKILTIKADAAICQGPPFYLSSFFIWLFKGRFPRLFFPFDWNSSMYKDVKKFIPKREILGEKYSSINCDAIIHKNDLKELDLLPESLKIKEKPIIHFCSYPLSEWFVNYKPREKLSYKDREIHIVYVGFFCDTKHQSMVSPMNNILKQNIHVHIYSNDKLDKKLISKITLNNKKLKNYLHTNKYVSPNKLSQEISKYDFGIHYGEFLNIATPKIEKIGLGNKRASYFEALIPIIIQKKMEFACKDVENNYLGILIKNVENLKRKIKQFDYTRSLENIRKFRRQNSVENNINRLIKFITVLNEK